jgi:ATP-dependent DNA helicase 2 subunit 2
MPDLRHLSDVLRPGRSDDGDAISAIVVAIQMIASTCKKLKYIRRIILVTNGIGIIEADEKDLAEITKKIKADNIELTILGVDFDDAEFGVKEEEKDSNKEHNELLLRQFAEDCGGVCGTMAEAIEQLGIPRMKATRPVTSYKGLLTLGDPEKYDSAMCIDIERYPKVMVAKPPTASKFVVRGDMAPGESSTQSSATVMNGQNGMDFDDTLASVKQARTYQIDDPDAPGGKRDVPMEELAKGYEYGRTAVPISESDMNVVKLESKASLDIVGFVDARQVSRRTGSFQNHVG